MPPKVQLNLKPGEYLKSIKFKLYPTERQARFIDRCIELNRYVYNWALEQQELQLILYDSGTEDHSLLSRNELERKFTALRNDPKHEFLKDIPHISARLAIWTLMESFRKFLAKICRHPKYKSKKNQESFYYKTRADRMFFEGSKVRIEGLPKNDMIDLKFDTGYTRTTTPKIYRPMILKDNLNNYWISCSIVAQLPETYFEDNNIPKLNRAIGIDLNVKKRFQLSTGECFYAPDLNKLLKRQKIYRKRVQKDTNRRKKQERTNPAKEAVRSKRSVKRLNKFRKVSAKIANVNENFIQTTTKKIINMRPLAVVMEHLVVTDMLSRHYMAKQVYHSCFQRSKEIMKFKCGIYGIPFIEASKYYPSSQLCSNCGYKQNIRSSKTYNCPHCGMRIDRDLNAALNLEHLAYPDNYYTINNLLVA